MFQTKELKKEVKLYTEQVDSCSTEEEKQKIELGLAHQLLALADDDNILSIYEEKNMDMIYTFNRLIVSNVTGKRQWNKFSDSLLLHRFVTPSDEAFAVLILENNCEKWRDELDNPDNNKSERKKARWSEGDDHKPRKWSKEALIRFMKLEMFFEEYREKRNDDYKEIEIEVKERETCKNDNKRTKIVSDIGETSYKDVEVMGEEDVQFSEFYTRFSVWYILI